MNFGYSILMIMCYTKQVWRRTEVAVTGLTRNQFTGFAPVRGFESLRLRVFKKRGIPLFIGISRFLSSIPSIPHNIYSYIFCCIFSTSSFESSSRLATSGTENPFPSSFTALSRTPSCLPSFFNSSNAVHIFCTSLFSP